MTFDLSPRPLNPAPPPMAWPNGAKSALFIGFDFDAETAWIGNTPSNVDRLMTVSHGGYDARVGIAKILELFDELALKATFFIPERARARSSDARPFSHFGSTNSRQRMPGVV